MAKASSGVIQANEPGICLARYAQSGITMTSLSGSPRSSLVFNSSRLMVFIYHLLFPSCSPGIPDGEDVSIVFRQTPGASELRRHLLFLGIRHIRLVKFLLWLRRAVRALTFSKASRQWLISLLI